MRFAFPIVALLALAGYRGSCARAPYDPCADLVCGSPCRACPPGDADCVETAVVKACDPAGACVAEVPDLCGAPAPVPGTCEGKSCGDACSLAPPCLRADPPCLAPTVEGACGPDGVCRAAMPACLPAPPPPPPPPPYDPCAGKLCGDECAVCPPDTTGCLEPAIVEACDASGACVPAPVACPTPAPPHDACAGKACHEPCQLCPPGDEGCMEPMYVKWCDGAGACVAEGTGAACP